MRAKINLHLVPHIGPAGMMVVLLGKQRHARHEGKSFAEIFELEFSKEPVVLFSPHGFNLKIC
jgi:hypothetical protein